MSSLLLRANFVNRGVRWVDRGLGLGIATKYFRSLQVNPRSISIFATRSVHNKREKRNILKIEATNALKNTDFASRLREFISVDGVLGFVDKQKAMEPIDIGMTLRRLVEINSGSASQKEDAISISQTIDDRIGRLAQRLATQVVDTDILLSILMSLRQLPRIDLDILRSVETKVHDRLGQMSISQLVRVVKITGGVTSENASNTKDLKINSNAVNDISKDLSDKSSVVGIVKELTLCGDALAHLERRWVEISNPQDIITLMYVVPHDANDRLWARVNERTLERSEVMSARQLYRVLYAMARRRRHNAPVMRSVVYHLNKRSLIGEALPQSTSLYCTSVNTDKSQPDTSTSPSYTAVLEIPNPATVPDVSLTLVQLSNLAYACATHNIRDIALLHSLVCAIKVSFDESLNVDNIRVYSSVLQSLAALHWLDGEVMDKICFLFTSSADKVTVSQWSSLIMSCSSLGYLPSSLTKDTLTSVFEKLRAGHQTTGYQRTLLDIVWSAVVLNMITAEMAASVLNKDFVNYLESSCSSNPTVARLKLLNIDAIVKHTMLAGYMGQSLEEEYINKISTALNVRQHGVRKKALLDTMNKIASADKYLRVDVKTSAGYYIDIELFTNDKGQLQPVADYTAVTSSGLSVLPAGIYRFAIKLLDASDMTLGRDQPTGLNILCLRYLAAVGYKVIQIPPNEMSDSTTIIKRVQYIHARIMDGLKETNTWPCSTSNTSTEKLHKEDNTEKSKRENSDAGSSSLQTETKGSLNESGDSNLVAAERVERKGGEEIEKTMSRQDDSRSNDRPLLSTRTDEKKQQQVSKSKLKLASSSHTGVSLDIRELYQEHSMSETTDKSTPVKDTKRRN